MSCFGTNSKNSCPAKMNDARAFTDYRPRCIVNAQLMNYLTDKNVVASSYESRMYLQHNADKLMEQYKTNAENTLLCGPCGKKEGISDIEQERYMVKCNNITCEKQEVNPFGIGDGRMY